MTTRIETANSEQAPTIWKRLAAWLTAFEEALDYGPQDYTEARIAHLGAEVERLEARLVEVETGNQRAV